MQDLEKLDLVHNLILLTSMQSTLLRPAKEKAEKTMENPKEKLKGAKGSKRSGEGKGSTKGSSGLEQSKSEANSDIFH